MERVLTNKLYRKLKGNQEWKATGNIGHTKTQNEDKQNSKTQHGELN